MKISKRLRGFTLIELLVVIGIIVVLSVVVVLTLNPAELLKQERDSNRVSDMATLKSSLSLYMADVTSPNLASSSNGYASCFAIGSSTASGNCTVAIGTYQRFFRGVGIWISTGTVANQLNVNSTGWLPVSFDLISSGSPISALPIDPVDNSTYFYGYSATTTPNLAYKLSAKMESGKYSKGGSADIETADGGSASTTYEVGTQLSL